MTQNRTLDTTRIAELERGDSNRIMQLSLHERSKLLSAVCRDAAEIEASRIKMGMPPSQPAPWPESTWRFLAEAARRVREQT